jgi:hypothetical protein
LVYVYFTKRNVDDPSRTSLKYLYRAMLGPLFVASHRQMCAGPFKGRAYSKEYSASTEVMGTIPQLDSELDRENDFDTAV